MKIYTPQEIYNTYHKEFFNLKHGFYPRPIVNWQNYTTKDFWTYIETFTNMVNNNAGQIDPNVYMKALAISYQGQAFDLKTLSSPRSISIYKNYVEQLNHSESPDAIQKSIYDSIRNVSFFIKQNDLKTFEDYLDYDKNLIPIVAKHYSSGTVSKYFLSLIHSFPDILKKYPTDAVEEYLKDFEVTYITTRNELMKNENFRKISDNLETIIQSIK